MKSAFALLAGALLLAPNVRAQDTSSPGALETYATFTSAGVRLPVIGDDDGDAAVGLEVREAGGQWRPAHPLVRTAGGVFIGSLFFLAPGTGYEVRLTLADPDNAAEHVITGGLTTRTDAVPSPPQPEHLYVAPGGDDGGPGSQAQPLEHIQAAADRAGPGTVVHVAAGVYREAVQVNGSGEPGDPIVFAAEPGAVLDGADEAIQSGQVAWNLHADDIWWTPFDGQCRYAAFGPAGLATRLYDYPSLADLEAETGGQAGQTGVLPGGFYVDAGQQRLYLRLPDRSDPNGQPIHAARLRGAFLLDGRHDVVVDGFEARFYGSDLYSGYGVDVRASDRVWVRNCRFHNMNTGVRIRRGGAENVVEHNRIEDTSVWGWPWASVKAHEAEASGISVGGGRGNVVRHNLIEGPFNGIYVGEFSDAPEPELATETDVIGNNLRHTGDDGLEPEGACINVRFVDNRILGAHNGVSLAPIQVGPTWLVNNLVADFKAHALKLNNGSSGPILVYHTTGVPAADEDSAQAWAPSIAFGPLTSRNNVWVGNRYVIEYGGDSLLGPVDMDHDAWFTPRGAPVVKWLDVRYDSLAEFAAATGLQAHGLWAEPAFEDRPGGDFHLAVGHPALDEGLVIAGINDDPARVPDGLPDIGALERGGAAQPDGGPPDAGEDGGVDAGADPGTDAGQDGGADPDGGADEDADAGQAPKAVSGSCGCSGGRPGWTLFWLVIAFGGRRWRRG